HGHMVQEQMGKNCNIFSGRTYNNVKNFWSTRKGSCRHQVKGKQWVIPSLLWTSFIK
ncbi:hypothetical protein MKW92_006383, partial [Papaver armeniacum]